MENHNVASSFSEASAKADLRGGTCTTSGEEGNEPAKKGRTAEALVQLATSPDRSNPAARLLIQETVRVVENGAKSVLSPFFGYNDYSTTKDPDSFKPLTPPNSVPNFPAKLHSILSRPEFSHIVSWLPHGRAWCIHQPYDFEKQIIPGYFQHGKLSSFIRQANAWGFRRLTREGRDNKVYYHESFLRGLPHLCKQMRRLGATKNATVKPEHEPDLYKISKMYPVPEKAKDDSIILQCTIKGGPKARMTVSSMVYRSTGPKSSSFQDTVGKFESQWKNMKKLRGAAASPKSIVSRRTPMASPSVSALARLQKDDSLTIGASSTVGSTTPQVPTIGLVTFNQMISDNLHQRVTAITATNFQQAIMAASSFMTGFATAIALSQKQMLPILKPQPAASASLPPPGQSSAEQAIPHSIPSHLSNTTQKP